MMSKPTAHDLRAVAVGRLLRRAFEDGAKWVAQVDDPARSRVSMDRGFAEFRESHYDEIIEIEAKTDANLLQVSSPSPGAVETPVERTGGKTEPRFDIDLKYGVTG